MNQKDRNYIIEQHRLKYIRMGKREKTRLLSYLEVTIGMHRKSILRIFTIPLIERAALKKRGGSIKKYSDDSNYVLQKIWEARDGICAELLHPYIAETIDMIMCTDGFGVISTEVIDQVRRIPLGTLKYKLRSFGITQIKRYPKRNPLKGLNQSVPISTMMNTITTCGSLELDFVDHNGGNASGPFVRTLCATDVASGYIVRRCIMGKTEQSVQEVFQIVIDLFPFPIHHLHTDNEISLLNSLIYQQAHRNNIVISRSRSYHKQDNGHVEQKNGDKIRNLVGYRRYDTREELNILNELYILDDIIQNHYIPSMKLKEKQYNQKGKLIRRIYDQGVPPYTRIVCDTTVALVYLTNLTNYHDKLNLVVLQKQRTDILKKL